ncbi:Transmembrane protein [Trema orientale]|uniref:Transmembrane protein n=1 Tax=Trema orientale TaxID=63057 RepID=A0A2P5EDW7_TREOI|nr:Transmembrane protein [Trema orientale]
MDHTGWTPVHYAGRLDFHYLISLTPASVLFKVDEDGMNAFHIVVKHGCLRVVEACLKIHPGILQEKIINDSTWALALFSIPKTLGDTPLHVATKKGHIKIVKELAKIDEVDGKIKNDNGYTALNLVDS